MEDLINELAAEYTARDQSVKRAEVALRAQLEADERARAEAYVRSVREEKRARAAQWARTLDPRSKLGQWFDEFARSYPDRVSAAEVYLQSLDEADRLR